ncbi:uncharacterized protein N7459_003122 [Penicillium hispanicum]|uniref:uncharacterized protein n=1 Tax=Penicillium hispanicum TaxID=1080232 RepID=UPI002541EF8A|nr:uncharacterized protein N7459_003122 [Penicillium hispanicum]KAJ5587357.1 hypothetical protein N7459_003122 [Penicillium hispanicum]
MTPKGSRKRVKPSPEGEDSPSPAAPSNGARDRSDSLSHGRALINKYISFQSWYPGSWSAVSRVTKAAPVTEVARESISVAQNVASSVAESSTSLFDSHKRNRHQSIQLTKKAGNSTRSLPANVATTCVNIASDGSASTTALDKIEAVEATETPKDNKETSAEETASSQEKTTEGQKSTPDAGSESNASHLGHTEHTAPTEQSNGWFSWLYKSSTTTKGAFGGPDAPEVLERQPDKSQSNDLTSYPPTTQGSTELEAQDQVRDEELSQNKDTAEPKLTAQKRSWLQMWYGSASSNNQGEQTTEPVKSSTADPVVSVGQEVPMTPKKVPEGPERISALPHTPVGSTKSSGWSFWTKDAGSAKPQDVEAVEASIDSHSPTRATTLEPDSEANVNITKKGSIKVKQSKNNRVQDGAVSPAEATPISKAPPEPRPADAIASKELQRILPNQVLPRFRETYALEESPSLLQSLGRMLHYTKGPEHSHVFRVKDPPRIKRALAIGVHGYFPAPLIRSVLGQPTGTSIRFSNMAAEAIHKWTADHGYSCEVEKISLEGEGRIAERVDLLWKLLLNWMEEIRQADFILLACHSQGVPVSIMLVAKLISFGCVNASRVGICAMAGVNMGPFSSYRSRWISGSAGELFEFELPFSQVSKDYEASLKCALDFGVRISYVGSIDDQLVSLESSLFSPIAHPYIYRAVFVDGRVHAPSFLSHLVGFALKLRNLGIPDHGLIRELSGPLAGSLYSGEGHSRLYDDEAVYYMAIQFAMETSAVPETPLNIKRSSPAVSPNPYILPFAMRGLLEEEYVRRELHEETMELLRQFDDWKPSSKVLKDVKFRLEGIRSKL